MSVVEYNDDELVPPTWLNEAFIVRMLCERSNNKSDNVKVWDLHIKPATLKGDHYASLMFRVSFKYEYTTHNNILNNDVAEGGDGKSVGEESVIVKTMPASDTEKGKHLHDVPLHETEQTMYTMVIPAFEAIWKEHGVDIKFAGRLLYATTEPMPALVLEDLCPLGYITLSGRPFTLNEIHSILDKLSKWHAVSYKLAHESQTTQWTELTATFKRMQHGLFKMEKMMESSLMNGGMHTLIEVLTELGGFEEYLPRLRAIEPQLVARCIAMQDAYGAGVIGPIYVLNHGDFHAKNIMFREGANGNAEDFLFVDFQLNFFGTCTYDVRYATYTMIGRELRETKYEELLHFYFECFLKSLKQLQFNGKFPTHADFQDDWLRWKCYELYGLSTMCPLGFVAEGTPHELDINLAFTSYEYRKTFWKKPQYIAYIKRILPKLLKDGYLDE